MAVVLTVLGSACSAGTTAESPPVGSPGPGEGTGGEAAVEEPTLAVEAIAVGGGDCDAGIGAAPPEGQAQLTFIRDGRLYGLDLELGATVIEGTASCLVPSARVPWRWGPAADRAISGEQLITEATGPGVRTYAGLPTTASFTRPTGTSVIAVTDDGRLVKTKVDTGAETDISFLTRHDAVVYYPSGTHVITSGRGPYGMGGIWLATNQGTEAQLLASAEGVVITNLHISEDGASLVFVADHGDVTHVHRALLAGAEILTGEDEAQAETLVETTGDVASLVLTRWGEVAVAYGDCGAGYDVYAEGLREDQVERMIPIAYLGQLVLMADIGDACSPDDRPYDLYVVQQFEDTAPVLLVSQVSEVDIRLPVGEPPPPPSENFSGFA